MMRKCNIILVLLLAAIVVGAGLTCAKPAPKPSPLPTPAPTPAKVGWPKAVTVCSSTASGTFYIICAGISDMINKYVGVPANVEAAGGSVAATKLLGQGLVHMAIMLGSDVIDAYYGIREQAKPIKVRLILNGHQSVFHLIALTKSGIKTVSDMNGRRYQFDKVGSANRPFGQTLVKCAKLDVKVIPWESSEATCKDVAGGTIDIGQTSAIGSGALRELFLQHDAMLIPIPEDVRDCMVKTYPGYVKAAIPKGYYQARGDVKYPPADLPGIGYDAWVACRADLPDDLVYQIAKAIMDNPKEFSNYHAEAKHYRLEGATDNPLAPFHPGVVKYYKEKGVWTDALQKTQEKLLAEEPK